MRRSKEGHWVSCTVCVCVCSRKSLIFLATALATFFNVSRRSCFGRHSDSSDEPEVSSDRHESLANLAAQHELNELADVRESETEEDYEDAAAKTEADRQRQPFKRRFGVKLTRISHRLPAITSYLPSFSRSSKSPRDNDDVIKERAETSGKQSDRLQCASQPATAVRQSETSEPMLVSSQDPIGSMGLSAGTVQFSCTPILSVTTLASGQ